MGQLRKMDRRLNPELDLLRDQWRQAEEGNKMSTMILSLPLPVNQGDDWIPKKQNDQQVTIFILGPPYTRGMASCTSQHRATSFSCHIALSHIIIPLTPISTISLLIGDVCDSN